MKQQLANLRTRRFWLMMLGLVIMSAGIALFRLARLGNDPFTGMCFAISDRFSVSLGHVELAINAVLFVGMCFSLRHRIGWGTLFNAFLVGYVVEFFAKLFEALYQPSGLAAQIVVCMLALLITCLGCSLYLNADMGASPYDATALALAHHTPVLPLPHGHRWPVCRRLLAAGRHSGAGHHSGCLLHGAVHLHVRQAG